MWKSSYIIYEIEYLIVSILNIVINVPFQDDPKISQINSNMGFVLVPFTMNGNQNRYVIIHTYPCGFYNSLFATMDECE